MSNLLLLSCQAHLKQKFMKAQLAFDAADRERSNEDQGWLSASCILLDPTNYAVNATLAFGRSY